MLPHDLIAPKDAARIAGCHVSTLLRWILHGRLRGYRKAGSRYLVSRADVEGVIAEVVPRRRRA